MRGGVALHIGRGSTSHWTFDEPAVTLASPLECARAGEPPSAAKNAASGVSRRWLSRPLRVGSATRRRHYPQHPVLVASTPERLVMLMRVNSSETVGWMPTVPSKSRFLAPIFIATA